MCSLQSLSLIFHFLHNIFKILIFYQIYCQFSYVKKVGLEYGKTMHVHENKYNFNGYKIEKKKKNQRQNILNNLALDVEEMHTPYCNAYHLKQIGNKAFAKK